jgi:hypothetical protein
MMAPEKESNGPELVLAMIDDWSLASQVGGKDMYNEFPPGYVLSPYIYLIMKARVIPQAEGSCQCAS